MSDLGAVRRRLGLTGRGRGAGAERLEEWLSFLDTVPAPVEPVVAPTPADLPDVARRLAVGAEDAAEIAATMPAPATDPELWWLLERCVSWVRLHLDTHHDPEPPWADLPPELGPAGRLFHAHVVLAALPDTLALHRALGVEPAVSWATLADLGSKMAMYRRAHGTAGLDKQDWLTLHLRGGLFALGRLQLALTDLTPTLRLPPTDHAVALGVHVPETGPLSPAAVEDSLARARDFFADHVPTPVGDLAVCTSWLLDPTLADHLPATSNIVAFQRRFTLTGDVRPGDADILEFVTGRADRRVADIPRTTTLERAVGDHLRAGGHWTVRTGWLRLPGRRPTGA